MKDGKKIDGWKEARKLKGEKKKKWPKLELFLKSISHLLLSSK